MINCATLDTPLLLTLKKFEFETHVHFHIKRLTFGYTDKLNAKTYFWCKQFLQTILYNYIV